MSTTAEPPATQRVPVTAEMLYAGVKEDTWLGRRTYVGASVIGDSCERKLWYSFRWVNAQEDFDGRKLILFQAGHDGEERMADVIRKAGIELATEDPATGKQYEFVDHAGHFKCHPDGFARVDGETLIWESKTMNDANFKALKNKGVRESKPMHYAQMMSGMAGWKLDRALYTVENKNTSELYVEEVEFDPLQWELIREKAKRVIYSEEPLRMVSEKPDWYECKFCDAYDVCKGDAVPLMNCRTCIHSTPVAGGQWHCRKFDNVTDNQTQRAACRQHVYRPDLLRIGEPIDAGTDFIAYKTDAGVFVNGANQEFKPNQYESFEIAAAGTRTAFLDLVRKGKLQ